MKKLFITISAILMPMLAMGQVIAFADFTKATEFTGYSYFDDSQTDGKVELSTDGLAITVGIQTGQLWQPQVMVVPNGSFNLKEDGNYKVYVTAKFPCDGTLQINMGTFSANDQAQFPVTATGDFQEVECDFPCWSFDAEGAHLFFQCGDFKGTTIIKNIMVIDKDLGGTGTDISYNFIPKGKVAEVIHHTNGSYYGAIEIPEKVIHEGEEYTVRTINDGAFFSCCYMTSLTIPNTVTHIGNDAFGMCSYLSSVNITDLGTWCKITFNDTPLSYAHHLILNGEEIKDLVIPNNITSIGDNVFIGLSGLTSVTMHNNVTSIGNRAFCGCSGLTSVTIPNSVSSIGEYAFYGCSGLTSITIPSSVTSIYNYAFSGCTGLTSITIPNSVTYIDGHTFSDCTSLSSVTIPNSVTGIGDNAFSGCTSLSSITIGDKVTYISAQAFANCQYLSDVYSMAENVPYTDNSLFEGSYIEYATLHVPASAINAYMTTAPWSGFGEIVPISGEEMLKCATPTISFEGGKIKFSCETEGVEYFSEISSVDAGNNNTDEVEITGKITVKVYATKSGCVNSDTATAVIEVPGELEGDLNKDGTVNVADHVELTKIILGQE